MRIIHHHIIAALAGARRHRHHDAAPRSGVFEAAFLVQKKWPYAQIEAYNPADMAPALLRAAAHYHDARYLSMVRPEDLAKDVPTILLLAEQAVKENHSHIRYLEALLAMESEERDRHAISNRIRDAQLPRMKTLEEFDFAQAPQISAARIRELAEGGYVERSEPIVLIGEAGTGKSHLATGLCVAACRQKRRVRFTTAAALVNELVEAKQNNQVRRLMGRWQRYQLIALDEVGYVPLADIGAEFLFQVISDRAERAAIIITTNLPFSEWTTVFPNPRLCKALLDRITDRAHIIETGTESFRFRRTMERRRKP
jgi:DNA replication protein DnaC